MNDMENNILNRLFSEMGESLRKLRIFSRLSKNDFLGQAEKIDATKYNFIVAIEAMIDICNRIISTKNGLSPGLFRSHQTHGRKRSF
ncbi:MAG: DUF86 domain-containing protein [Proteobacteria bacterium]|nr:DUF86 domain-containing protein [Pseudomonadota bacterium]NIS70307.1 DUF86 domain-containing protein [Pseudomonadota bacterium]